jgi:hypothetical protein
MFLLYFEIVICFFWMIVIFLDSEFYLYFVYPYLVETLRGSICGFSNILFYPLSF